MSWLVLVSACQIADESAVPTSVGPDAGWLATVETTLLAQSYTFSFDTDGEARGDNVGQALTLVGDARGLSVGGDWGSMRFGLAAWGAPGAMQVVTDRSWAAGGCDDTGRVDPMGACIRRLEAELGGVTERWTNTPGALEHSFVVAEPVEGGVLWLDVAVPGAEVRVDEADATFFVDGADVPVGWRDLQVFDAAGHALEAHLEAVDGGVRVVVDTAGAAFPVTIDPVVAPYWFDTGTSASQYFGAAVAGIGDVNGDNLDDVAIGAYGVGSSAGAVYVYFGDQFGPGSTADWSYAGTQASAYLGYAVAGGGDYDGDGTPDLAVGAYLYDNGSTNEGVAYVFYGNGTSFSASPDWSLEGNQTSAYLGQVLANAGDTNGDGYDDLAIAAPLYDNGQTDEGRVFVVLGSSSGLASSAAWTGEPNQSSASYGQGLAAGFDINGDGYADLAAGAPYYDDGSSDEGEAWVYLGSSSGLSSTASWSYDADQATAYLGYTLAAGDFDGDGFDDVAVSAYYYDNGSTNEGKAWVFEGSSSGLGTTHTWTAEANSSSGYFGKAMVGVGDADADGDDELAVIKSSGTVVVYNGSSTSLGTSSSYSSATVGPSSASSVLGAAGDVDGDGYDDLLVADPSYSSSKGIATILFGSTSGIALNNAWTQRLSQTSYGNYDAVPVGDLDGDGYSDVAVGYRATSSTYYVSIYKGSASGTSSSASWALTSSTSSFGNNVAGGGDVNGDGYDDLVVSAYTYAPTYSAEGSVYVYYGGASGPSSSSYARVDGGQSNTYLGYDAEIVGDVNGDGYDDLAVALYAWDNGQTDEGGVRVYHGSSAGIIPSHDWHWESDQASAYITDVTRLGDIDGDGYDDVAFGSSGWDSAYTAEGKVWIAYGSASGLETTPSWSTTGGQTNAGCYRSFAGGDLDADGYADLVVGCTSYDVGTATDAGRVQAFHGSAAGPASTADWTLNGTTASDKMGSGAAILPDVDGDGDDELAVGASGAEVYFTDEGSVWVYLGDPAGLGSSADIQFVGLETSHGLGAGLDAGDIDDDGRGELVIRSTYYVYQYDFDDADADGVIEFVDCDDSDADRSPDEAELCDGIDNDCDGAVDESIPTWYLDADSDGYGDASYGTTTCTQPSGYADNDDDCDDTRSAVSPAATETCNSRDDDCDGDTDELGASGGSTVYADDDGDGYGDATDSTTACTATTGYASNDDDCDDTDSGVSPAASEYCDGEDDDCDGSTDETSAVDADTWYRDADGDGYGTSSTTTPACSQPSGYSASSTDCDDTDATVKPGATETCDGEDDDCDGSTDEGVATTYYLDADADGYGTLSTTTDACSLPSGYAANSSDCDDTSAAIKPGATETCNSADDDCDGSVDDGVTTTYYRDADSDGYGDSTSTSAACSLPSGYATASTDCDDTDAAVNPAATETCNDVDDDCDNTVDDGVATTTWYRDADGDAFGDPGATKDKCDQPAGYVANADDCNDAAPSIPDGLTWYADLDEDGYGDPTNTAYECTVPAGYLADAQDCDDTDPDTHPDAEEVWYDGTDQDCLGDSDYDQDQDGFDSDAYTGGDDCDDEDDAVNPDARDAWYDGVDTDCDGASDYDMDGDGQDSVSYGGEDCDDGNADRYAGAPDQPYDGKVEDCDGTFEYDADRDGHDSANYGGDDCDDANSGVYPGADEVWYDGVDEACDGGNDYDQDGDGAAVDVDCDDEDDDIVDCPEETGDTADSGDSGNGGGGGTGPCGCQSGAPAAALGVLLAGGVLATRRRR